MTNQLITYGFSLISLVSLISYVWQLLFQATTIPFTALLQTDLFLD